MKYVEWRKKAIVSCLKQYPNIRIERNFENRYLA
jgi:hypothetical protein